MSQKASDLQNQISTPWQCSWPHLPLRSHFLPTLFSHFTLCCLHILSFSLIHTVLCPKFPLLCILIHLISIPPLRPGSNPLFQEVALDPSQVILDGSVQFSSVAQSFPTLCDPMNRSTAGLPVHHKLPEFPQTHVHRISDAIKPYQSLSFPSPPTFNFSQHQGLFKWVSSWHQVAKVLEFQLQHQSFQWTPRTDLL